MTQNERTIRQMTRDLGRLKTGRTLRRIRLNTKRWSPATTHVVVFVDRATLDRATSCMPFVVCEVGPEGKTLDEAELGEGYSTGPYTFEVVSDFCQALDATFDLVFGPQLMPLEHLEYHGRFAEPNNGG